jgi:hypothetical protein
LSGVIGLMKVKAEHLLKMMSSKQLIFGLGRRETHNNWSRLPIFWDGLCVESSRKILTKIEPANLIDPDEWSARLTGGRH